MSLDSLMDALTNVVAVRIPDAVLIFMVVPNTFETYLAARPLVDASNIPSGWEIRQNRIYDFRIPDLQVKPTGKAPKAPPDPPTPPRRATTLD